MKRVLVVQRGLTHYRELLLRYVQEQGDYEINVVNIGKQIDRKGNVYYFPAQNLLHYKNYRLQKCPGMISFIKKHYKEYDYIVLEGATNLVNNIPICRFLLRHKKPYIIWDAGRRKNAKMSFMRKMAQGQLEFVWKHASAIIAYSTLAKTYFTGLGIPENKVFVCQNTLYVGEFDRQIAEVTDRDMEELRRKYSPEGQKIILYVGAVEPRKRIKDLIDAFMIVREQKADAVLMIIGGGEQLEELRQYTAEKKDIYLLGPVIKEVIKYFMLADVFVLPSEGGLSINQAMICGKPIIASSADGTELDLIEEGKNGYLFDEKDVKNMASKIIKVLSDDHKRMQMGLHSRKIIEQKVNEVQFYKNFKCCLESTDR